MGSQPSVRFFHSVPCSFVYDGQEHEVWGLLFHTRKRQGDQELHTYEVMTSQLQAFKIWFDPPSQSWLIERLS